jgi:hypothetical protein
MVSGYTRGVSQAARGYAFETLEEITRFNVRSAHLIEGTAQRLELDERPLESQYWWSVQSELGARQFISGLALALEAALADPDRSMAGSCRSALDVALAQRDVVQAYGLVRAATAATSDAHLKGLATKIEATLIEIARRLLFTNEQAEKLRAALPGRIGAPFSTVAAESLAVSYLPLRVIAEDTSWMEIQGGGAPFRHFVSYGGRSFIRVYIRSPGLRNEELQRLWRSLYRSYGKDLHITGVKEQTPAGLETMLIRTFGVFLEDGRYEDTGWPEEVILRRFKYSTDRVDPSSSDFRGTQFFQYKLDRSLLRKSPSSLGLRRVYDDDWQFYGFFGDVPDRGNSYSDAVTTMRSNCIACHSELFYGLSTIFSFERDPVSSLQKQLPVPPYSTTLDTLRRSLGDRP